MLIPPACLCLRLLILHFYSSLTRRLLPLCIELVIESESYRCVISISVYRTRVVVRLVLLWSDLIDFMQCVWYLELGVSAAACLYRNKFNPKVRFSYLQRVQDENYPLIAGFFSVNFDNLVVEAGDLLNVGEFILGFLEYPMPYLLLAVQFWEEFAKCGWIVAFFVIAK